MSSYHYKTKCWDPLPPLSLRCKDRGFHPRFDAFPKSFLNLKYLLRNINFILISIIHGSEQSEQNIYYLIRIKKQSSLLINIVKYHQILISFKTRPRPLLTNNFIWSSLPKLWVLSQMLYVYFFDADCIRSNLNPRPSSAFGNIYLYTQYVAPLITCDKRETNSLCTQLQ